MPPVPVPNPPPPPADPNADWTTAEKAWFEDQGITDEKEKEAIRGRARVLEYDRTKKEFNEKKKAPPEEKKKKWYDD